VENLTKHGWTLGRWAGVGLILLAFTACNDDGSGLICTDIFAYGLTIEVTDATTLLPITEASGTATEGEYQEELESIGTGTLVGAGERPGTYDIVVTAPGYQEWTRDEVTLGFDGCHVVGQSFDARLQPAG